MIRFSCEYWSLIALFRDQLVMLNVQSFHQALFPLTIALSLKVVVLKCLSSCCLGWIISKFNFQIHPPIHLIRLQLGSWNIIVQVQQQLLYDFMISSAFPFLALNFTPVSMACHRHTCQPCPCRHTGLASGGMVWAGVSIFVLIFFDQSLLWMSCPCGVFNQPQGLFSCGFPADFS